MKTTIAKFIAYTCGCKTLLLTKVLIINSFVTVSLTNITMHFTTDTNAYHTTRHHSGSATDLPKCCIIKFLWPVSGSHD